MELYGLKIGLYNINNDLRGLDTGIITHYAL